MNKNAIIVLLSLLVSGILVSCEPTQNQLNAEATEIVAEILASQTAFAQESVGPDAKLTPISTDENEPVNNSPVPLIQSPDAVSPTPTPHRGGGGQIAFESNRDGNGEIYVMNSDGSGVRRLTNDSANEWLPTWSPDGERIAFLSGRDGNPEIYVMNADGGDQRRLTNNPAFDGAPTWSPDGEQITFESNRNGNWELYVMNADGGDVSRLIYNSAEDSFPEFASDGEQIAFSSNRDGNDEIYVMNADGGE